MISFRVPDMFSCRSAGAITKCVKALDSEATVRVDMSRYWVDIDSGWVPEQTLSDAIGKAGFTPESVASSTRQPGLSGDDVDLYLPFD